MAKWSNTAYVWLWDVGYSCADVRMGSGVDFRGHPVFKRQKETDNGANRGREDTREGLRHQEMKRCQLTNASKCEVWKYQDAQIIQLQNLLQLHHHHEISTLFTIQSLSLHYQSLYLQFCHLTKGGNNISALLRKTNISWG